ncbi:MAG TPA: hypothetical protein VKB57_01525 [Acidimicrobiales bacterium]|nr:hypothetical protein [Acidimicrobiales bacterium]
MTFEDTLRDRLEHDAASVPLPPRTPARAAARARVRHRNRLVVTGVVAVLAVGTAVAVPTLLAQGEGRTPSAEVPATQPTLPPGPLDLSWRKPTSGGIMYAGAQVQSGSGTVYAISTAPGFHYGDPMSGTRWPIALYRLGDDGRWQPTDLGGRRPYADNLAAAGDTLYAVSTAPGTHTLRVGASRDGGDTWTSDELPPAAFPTGSHDLTRQSYGTVAAKGDQVLAMVVTRFYPDEDAIFPEKKGHPDYIVQRTPEGLALVKVDVFRAVPGPGGGKAAVLAPGTATAGAPTTTVPASPTTSQPRTAPSFPTKKAETIRTVPWSDLGLHGLEDLGPKAEIFERTGDGWERVEAEPADFGGQGEALSVAGDRFVVTGIYGLSEGAFVSQDGRQWNRIPVATGDKVVGTGPGLVRYPQAGTKVQVSTDGGTTWTAVDLGAEGAEPNLQVISASGGPLGVALLLGDAQEHPRQLVVSADLASWTVGDVAQAVGAGSYVKGWTFVGADRIVVGAERAPGGNDAETVTAVGTPVRR